MSIVIGASNNLLQSETTGEPFLGPILREQCFGSIDSYSWGMVEVGYESNKITAFPSSIGLLVVEEDVLGALVKIYIVVREICVHVVFGQTDECINTKTMISPELERSGKRLKTFWGSYSLEKVSVSDSLLIASLLITREVVECCFGGFNTCYLDGENGCLP